MANPAQRDTQGKAWLARPEVGSVLTILSGLAFLFLCMILPLVGKAGVQTTHYRANVIGFLIALLVAGALSGLAVKSKLERRKVDQSPMPRFSMLILAMCVLLFLALLLGLLKI